MAQHLKLAFAIISVVDLEKHMLEAGTKAQLLLSTHSFPPCLSCEFISAE